MADIISSSDSASPIAFPATGHSSDDPTGPLISGELGDSFSDTRRLRADGWTTFARRVFLDLMAGRGSVTTACRAAGLSAQSAYELRNRDPLFATAWDAALVLARRRLADDLLERALSGCIEQIHRDGAIVAERHRYDNKLSIAVLTRLDRRLDRAEERGEAHLRAAAEWDAFSGAVAEERAADALALIAPPQPPPEPEMHHQLHQLNGDNREFSDDLENDAGGEEDDDRIWIQDYTWRTNFPPPADFHGDQDGFYGDDGYNRQCTFEEREILDRSYPGCLDEARKGTLDADEAERDALFAALAADLDRPAATAPAAVADEETEFATDPLPQEATSIFPPPLDGEG